MWADNLGALSIDDSAIEDYDIMFNAKGDGFILDFLRFNPHSKRSKKFPYNY